MTNQKTGFRIFRTLIWVIGLLLILMVNREFGVADNGDFIRHTGKYVSKPSMLKENQPSVNSDEHKLRFFTQPIFYWAAQAPGDKTEFNSANIFWMMGVTVNKYLFSPTVINLKYVGIVFFLIHCAAYSIIAFSIKGHSFKDILSLFILFFIYSDARVTALYNSFYTESVPLLALMVIFAYFMVAILKGNNSKHLGKMHNLFSLIVLISITFAIFAKYRYTYFLIPATIMVSFIANSTFNANKIKVIVLFFAAIGTPIYLAVNNRIENKVETSTSKINSYHALYFGMLPLSNKKSELLTAVNLPQDSLKYLGKQAFNEDSQKFISATNNLNLKTVLKAIYYDPIAFCKLIFLNAQEVGNFDIYLGMVPGTDSQHPPKLITGITNLATQLSGLFFCGLVFVSGCILYCFKFNSNINTCYLNKVLITILGAIFLLDIVSSTFDGNGDARRHLLIASVAGVLIISQLFILWINFVAKQFQDISH